MILEIEPLWQAVKNASLFARAKSWNGGEVEFSSDGDKLNITSSDDFIGITTRVPVVHQTDWVEGELYISAKDLRQIENDLRVLLKPERNPDFISDWLRPHASSRVMLDIPGASAGEPPPPSSTDPDWWHEFYGLLLAAVDSDPVDVRTWDCSPERLMMLNRLEPKGQYPLSWKSAEYKGTQFWGLMYGPNTTGIVMPLDRGEIQEKHGEWLW